MLQRIIAIAAALASAIASAAEGFPDKPVRFIVPFPPGGGTDAFARTVGAKLAETWEQPVLVDNRAGAQGNVGTALAARAVPDGYTILLAHQGALTINPHLTDLLTGNVSMMFANPTSTVPQVKAGKLRASAVLGPKRNETLPDVPSAAEAGYPQMTELLEWYGVAVPAATPRDVIFKLNAAIVRALNAPDVVARLVALGQTPSPCTPEAFTQQIRTDLDRWEKIVKASGVKVE